MRPFEFHELPRQRWRRCPTCGQLQDGLLSLDGVLVELDDGSWMICAHCTNWGVADSTVENGWRLPTAAERREAAGDQRFALALLAAKETRRRVDEA